MRSIVGKQAEGHAERLVHKVDTFNDLHRAAQAQVRGLIWEFYADLKAYQVKPGKRRARALRTPELSGGEKQGPISHALAAEPDLLLCDEITSALDPIGGASVIALIEDLRDRVALGVMLVSHNLMTVSRIADEVNVLRHGVIVERGAPADVLQAPLHPYTKLLVRIGSQTGYWLGGASRSCSCPSGTRR
jgi:ABC-type glutathione transport system ATPase component